MAFFFQPKHAVAKKKESPFPDSKRARNTKGVGFLVKALLARAQLPRYSPRGKVEHLL